MVNQQIDDVVAAYLPQFKAILELMNSKYPELVITPSSSLEDVMYQAGQRSVLHHFRQVVENVESEQKTISEV